MISFTLIDVAVLIGIGVVAPLALGRARWWAVAGVAAAASFGVGQGPGAGALAASSLATAVLVAAAELRSGAPLPRTLAAGWAVVATASLVASRLGLRPFGIGEPIVELTAVHYLFAGTGAITLAGATGSRAAVAITVIAPPVVALGFVTGWAAPQVGGAVLMAIGVLLVAALQLRLARRRPGWRGAALVLSGLAVWAPMALAVAWAAGQHWEVPALSVPDMVRWHGLPNAVGFVVVGLLGSREGRTWPG